MAELKRIHAKAVPRALEKAERYRLLNEPEEAESICRDVLAVDAENRQALVMMLLALSDQFARGTPGLLRQAEEHLAWLADPYERAYYAGILAERWGKAQTDPRDRRFAHQQLVAAMGHFEKAQALAPAGNDDAVLRYNAYVRYIERHGMEGAPEEFSFDRSSGDEVPPR